MNGFLVLGVVVLLLFLLLQVRVGGALAYGAAGLRVRLRFGRFYATVYPMKPRREKPKKEKKRKVRSKPEKPEGESAPRRNTWAMVKEFLPVIAQAAGRFQRKVRVDRLDLELTVAAGDPAAAAIAFGAANGAIGMMIPILENNLNVKERRIRTRVDYDRTTPAVELAAAFSLTLGQGLTLGAATGVHAFKAYRNQVQKQKEAV